MPSPRAQQNFIVQQGFAAPAAEACPLQYRALVFQPRIVAVAVVAGIVLQTAAVFAALGCLLAWSAAFPRLNPFEALHNRLLTRRPGAERLGPAPTPRRFTQGLAAFLTLATAVCMASGWSAAAWSLEAFILAAVLALGFGGLCFGSFVYHLVRGHARFAWSTLPWGKGEPSR